MGFLDKGRELTVGRLFREGYVGLVALLFVFSGLSYLIDPGSVSRTAVAPHPYDWAVNGLYVLGGAIVLVGFLDRRPGIESAGHAIFVPALVTACAFGFAQLGVHLVPILVAIFALASTLRAIGLALRWQETLK